MYYALTSLDSEKNTTFMAILNLIDKISSDIDNKCTQQHYKLGIRRIPPQTIDYSPEPKRFSIV